MKNSASFQVMKHCLTLLVAEQIFILKISIPIEQTNKSFVNNVVHMVMIIENHTSLANSIIHGLLVLA